MQQVVPALRITNYVRSKAFYVDGLGFHIDWEHRFDESLGQVPPRAHLLDVHGLAVGHVHAVLVEHFAGLEVPRHHPAPPGAPEPVIRSGDQRLLLQTNPERRVGRVVVDIHDRLVAESSRRRVLTEDQVADPKRHGDG